MNDFMRRFLNVPKNGTEDIFVFNKYIDNKIEIDKRFDELYTMLRLTYNINIKDIVNTSVDKFYSTENLDTDITVCLNEIINNINNTLKADYSLTNPYTPSYSNPRIAKHEKNKLSKDIKELCNIHLNRYSTIEYIICNLYHIIISKNFSNTFSLKKINNRFPSIIADDLSSKTNDTIITQGTLERSTSDNYKSNYLYDLLLSVERLHINNNHEYIYSEDFEEIIIASALLGSKNVYRNSSSHDLDNTPVSTEKETSYSLDIDFMDEAIDNLCRYGTYSTNSNSNKRNTTTDKYTTFVTKYAKIINQLYKKYKSDKTTPLNDKSSKENIVCKYRDYSLHSTKYLSDMLYAFSLSYELSILYSNVKNMVKSHNVITTNASILYLIPELLQRDIYAIFPIEESCNEEYDNKKFNLLDRIKVARFNNMINFDVNVYYPIIILSAIECFRKVYTMQSQKNDFGLFCLEELNKIYINLSKRKLLYHFKFKKVDYNEILDIYDNITADYICKDYITELGNKITNHTIDIPFFSDNYL